MQASEIVTVQITHKYRLVQQTLQVMEMAWMDDSTLAIFYMSEEVGVQWLQQRNRESGNKDKRHQQIAMQLPLSL